MVTVAWQLTRLTNCVMFMWRRNNMNHVLVAMVIKRVASIKDGRLVGMWALDAGRTCEVVWTWQGMWAL